jgi:Rrf2 family transcriptional regulator, cysteine metabolism repressor
MAMKLSTKGRYGTRALLDLALHQGDNPVQLKDIARRQNISLSYLEHLITPLRAGGLVRSIRGPGGGVALTKSPGEIKLSEVIRLLEGDISVSDCVNDPRVCNRSAACVTRDVWDELEQAMNGILEATTLQNLVEREQDKSRPEVAMYYV